MALDRDAFARDRAFQDAQLRAHGASDLADTLAALHFSIERVQARGFARLPDRWLSDGERIELRDRTLVAHLTPGHSRGHLMFLDEAARVLFAGDHVLPHITPSIGFEGFSDGHGLEAFLSSLRASRELPADVVLPGHGPVFADSRAAWTSCSPTMTPASRRASPPSTTARAPRPRSRGC